MKLDTIITRHFTKSLEENKSSVWSLFKWKRVDVKITNYTTGETISEMNDLEFPEHFSQRACDIIANNYFRKSIPNSERGYEHSYKSVVHRMVQFWVNALKDEGVITTVKESDILYDELCYMMCAQMFAPNSPQWFNTGLKTAYNITGEGRGHYYYDEQLQDVVEAKDSYSRTQGSACFILGIQDALLGDHSITDNLTTETRLFKYGSGVGSNFSAIRGEGERLSGGGKSSGLMSFLNVFDRNAGAIKSGGTTRRAAKMNIVNVDHPDIEQFINWKAHEEQKVRDLGKMGYDISFTGEAYATVSGQNANNSVRFTDEFMRAVMQDEDWELISRTTGKSTKTVKARELWRQVAQCAWECGDPGVQFHDTINNWNTCKVNEYGESEEIVASNPCSEYMFLNDTACNLASLNLMAFVKGDTFNFDDYLHCISLVHLVLEATIHWGQFPTKDIARRSYLYRTTGMGYANLGALLLNFAIPYGSEAGSDVGAYLMSAMTAQCYKVSAMLAEKVGAFSVYKENAENVEKVINKHAFFALEGDSFEAELTPEMFIGGFNYMDALLGNSNELDGKASYDRLTQLWEETKAIVKEHGVRNAQVTVLAPTGTISFAMDCSSTSAEPFFNHLVYKKVVDGSFITLLNPISEEAMRNLGLTSAQIKEIQEHLMQTGSLYDAPHLNHADYPIFKVANDYHEELTLTPREHLVMMAKLTQQVSGAISKTVNLPSNATVEDVQNVFMDSWEMGIKAITIYRDGSKASQPLNLSGQEKQVEDMSYAELVEKCKELSGDHTMKSELELGSSHVIQQNSKLLEETKALRDENEELKKRIAELEGKPCVPERRKPHGKRQAIVHEATVGDLRIYVTVTKDENGNPIEVFTSCGRQGSLTKGVLESMSMLISLALQSGIPCQQIAKLLRGHKYEPNGFVGEHENIKFVDSISDLFSKILDIECGDYTYCQVRPDTDETVIHTVATTIPQKEKVSGNRVYGKICKKCGSNHMVKAGTCYFCESCGNSDGGCA